MAVCTPWITAEDLACDPRIEDTPPEVVDFTVNGVIEWLDDMTCGQFPGTCRTLIRPVLGCTHRGGCRCSGRWDRLDLSQWVTGPVTSVIEVLVSGEVVDPEHYAVINQRFFTAMDADDGTAVLAPWPRQNVRRPEGAEGTWSVEVEHGQDPPAVLALAAAELTCQMLMKWNNIDCDLPDDTSSITRSGVTVSLAARQRGRVGLRSVDSVLDTYGCTGEGQGPAPRLIDLNAPRAILRRT